MFYHGHMAEWIKRDHSKGAIDRAGALLNCSAGVLGGWVGKRATKERAKQLA